MAQRLGRELDPKRGSEPAFKNQWFPELRVLLIPNKSPLKKGTSRKILNQLEIDLAALERRRQQLGRTINGGSD